MDVPYYVSPPKVAHILGSSAAQIREKARSTELSATLGASDLGVSTIGVSAKVGMEASPITPEVAHVLPFVKDAVKALGRLPSADDPALSYKDWFVLEGPARFGVLWRDSGPDGGNIAVWLVEQDAADLGMASWVVLTGTPDHLDEAWTGALYGNRSGSGTDAVFDALRAAGAELPFRPGDLSDEGFFHGVSGMSGMLARMHRMRAVVQVLDVRTWRDSRYETASGLPIVRVVVGSPLYVEAVQTRPVARRQARLSADASGLGSRLLSRVSRLRPVKRMRRSEAKKTRALLSVEDLGDNDQ